MIDIRLLSFGFDLDIVLSASTIPARAVQAEAYQTSEGVRIEGVVSDHGVYRVDILLSKLLDQTRRGNQRGQLLNATCTCGSPACRHMAAAICHAKQIAAPPQLSVSEDAATLEPRIQQWLAGFEHLSDAPEQRGKQYELRYVLELQQGINGHLQSSRQATMHFWRVPMKSGLPNFAAAEPYSILRRNTNMPQFMFKDMDILQLLEVASNVSYVGGYRSEAKFILMQHPVTNLLLSKLLQTNRLCWNEVTQPLSAGPERQGEPYWKTDHTGAQMPSLHVEGIEQLTVLPLSPPWGIDERQLMMFPIKTDTPERILSRFLNGPRLSASQARALAQKLTSTKASSDPHMGVPDLRPAVPVPNVLEVVEEKLPFTPKLLLSGYTLNHELGQIIPVAELRMGYGGLYLDEQQASSNEKLVNLKRGSQVVRTQRNKSAEQRTIKRVYQAGFEDLHLLYDLPSTHEHSWLSLGDDEFLWMDFLEQGRPQFEAAGIQVEVLPSFPLRFAQVDDWYGEAEDKQNGWFTLDLGVVVDGERQSLIPLLTSLIAERPHLFTPEALAELSDDDLIFATLGDGRRVPLPAKRVRSIISVLVELNLRELPEGPLRLPILDAARLAALDAALQARWVGAEQLLELGRRLQQFEGITPVAPPQGLQAELRPYQEQGLAWLQFLREYEMGGILADDMGLGKAQPLSAPVLTPLGWSTMGQLQVGDHVMGANGRPTRVMGVYPQGLREIYRLTCSDGSSVEADLEHLWAVQVGAQDAGSQQLSVMSTQQLLAALPQQPLFLPLVQPLQFAEAALPHDPELRDPYTLGVVLTESAAPTSTEELSELAPHLSPPTQTAAGNVATTTAATTANQARVRANAASIKAVFWGSVAQRTALLQGLLDRGGHSHAGYIVYQHLDRQHVQQVQALVRSLGGTAQLGQFGPTGQPNQLSLCLPPAITPFRLPNKLSAHRSTPPKLPQRAIVAIEHVGQQPAQCIAVAAADHLYVTQDYIVTHNTLQTLAHLQTEKEAGRADLPSLVVVPTSVVGNWKKEAARFAPELKVLTLHGQNRKEEFGHMNEADIVLTTYPLLARDLDVLENQEFHLLILDEAQNIKNAKTAAAKAAGSLKARHRLCLTGTPLENHLGELWSQFNFLAPGLLYDEKTFRELYRTPIEKRGDTFRQRALAARIKPFILRRDKRTVVQELPPKTEIPVRVSLEGDQRDLYETVRVTMESRVREELEARGLARSTIAILDALLKLRQAVTDPRLVKLEAAKKVKHNAKLTWLQENLPEMVSEGRRILLFSSFATLLGHLESMLKTLKIPYSKITGQTRDRQKQIDAFQNGETHVFLITLKAGGVGLNLTAADTVIHYDPWWNPAAEDQATDRAYRIGQDKPVFVYKLIAAGSVEERILQMQARKAALAKGVLDGGLSSATQLTMNDLNMLFAPLNDDEE